jgi:hypothetical protein
MNPKLYGMTQEEFDTYVEDCIKSEMETFHPEEFEIKYGEKSRYYHPKMKIYTYYQDINFKEQDELVELWKQSWSAGGFEPVVLSLEDALRCTYYEEFVKKINELVLQITEKPLSAYGLSCYLRWLAYSTQVETDSFLVSDYDVLNKNFSAVDVIERKDKLSFMDNLCPCFAYGTKEQFLAFCEDIIYRSSENTEQIKFNFFDRAQRVYHDQNFLVLHEKELSNYNICRPRSYVMPYMHKEDRMKDARVVHFSHNSIAKTKEAFPELKDITTDTLRIKLIKEMF